MAERYLVTGGAGFIGSNLVKRLLEKSKKVRVLDNFSTGKRENIIQFAGRPDFELIEGDLRSSHLVRAAMKDVDFVLHQGALPSVPRSINDPITTNEVNISGTLNILDAAKEFKIRRVVFASSSSVYGNSEILPKSEQMSINPISPYALTKYAGERYCQIFFQLYGVETVCLRYFNVFGPNQNPSSEYSAVIPKFINLMLSNRSPKIYGDGNQSRDFTYIENVVNANLLACTADRVAGHVFNIASGERYSLLSLVEKINEKLKTDTASVFDQPRAGDVEHSLADISKAKEYMNYTPIVRFEEGLFKLIDHLIDQKLK